MKTELYLHAYLRRELQALAASKNTSAELRAAIEKELERRDDLNRKAADRLTYPHLSHS